jgi:hypothetical protein
MSIRDLILDFLYKFFFILKAAADGTIITYIGGNKFEFKAPPSLIKFNSNSFISKYSKNLPLFILKK